MMRSARASDVDMSPEAIVRRLQEVAALYRLGLAIARARRIGPVSGKGASPPAACPEGSP
jgi:hypothetical protein